MTAKFTYIVTTSCLKYAPTEPRQPVFAAQEAAYLAATSNLPKQLEIQAESYQQANFIATAVIATKLGCSPAEVGEVHRICVHPHFQSDERSRRILRQRSLKERRSHTDWEGIALPYLRAKWWRTDFDTHIMNIADMIDGKSRLEFLSALDW